MVTLKCPECRRKFRWDTEVPWPDYCPFKDCSAFVGIDRPDDEIVMPFVRSEKYKRVDTVYRDMERASEQRAEAAAEMAGVPVSDMSDLKITDLKSTRHPGDVAAPPLAGSARQLEQLVQAHPGVVGHGAQRALEYSAAVTQGPHPNAGARMRAQIQDHHRESVMQHVQRPGSADVVFDNPTIETQHPMYRRRA